MIGKVVSHFRILEELGRGGMGVVYKAHDQKLDRDVAIKFLPRDVNASSADRERFALEAKAAASLNHPHISTIHSIEEVDGETFFAMEYVDGQELRSRIQSKPLSVNEVAEIGIQIAEGLQAAHKKGIVHRDVKSSNIMLTADGNVKIMDFGLAKLLGVSDLTRSDVRVGTLAYMSPEQLRGEDIDWRSDLFAFGVVLYEMTTSRLPFRGIHEPALMYSIANEDPSPPSSLRPDVPPALERVITKCLQKDRASRYQSAEEISTELRAFQRESTGTVRTVVVKQPAQRLWILIAALGVVGAVIAYVFIPAFHAPGVSNKTIAVLPFLNYGGAKEEEYLCDGMTDDVLTQLVKIPDLKVISRTTMMQYKGATKTSKEIGRELNARVILEGSIRRAGDKIRIVAKLIDAVSDENLWADTYDREFKEIFSIQSEIAQKIALSLQATLSPAARERLARPATASPEAYTAYLQGRYFLDRKSKQDVENAISYFERALRIDSSFALAWVGLSLAHGTQADYNYAPLAEGYGRARKEGERALALDPLLADAHTNLGWIQKNYDWDWTGADTSFQRAIALEPGNAAALRGASASAFALGRFDEAIAMGTRAIELDPLNPGGYYNLGSYAYYAGRWGQSESAYAKANELSPQYPAAQMGLSLAYLAQSRPQEAFDAIQKEPTALWRLQGLALAYHALGKNEEANRALMELIKEHQSYAAFQIAEVYAFRGEKDSAFEWLERAHRLRDGGFAAMKGNPLFRGIEKDPRYAEIMRKVKLPLE